MSSSKSRIQNYLRQNKISDLFEEMMGKLVRDLPASPIYYLLNFLQEKEKNVKKITRQENAASKEKAVEVSANGMLWATAITPAQKPTSPRGLSSETNPQSSLDTRKYEKPWLPQSKKSPSKSKTSGKLNQTAPANLSKPGKVDWNQKTKIATAKRADDVVDGDDGVDLGLVYAKPKIVGEAQVKVKSEEEEMEAELQCGKHTEEENNVKVHAKSSKISAKEVKRKRLEELRLLAESAHPKSKPRSMSPLQGNNDSDGEDALEVLEDADQLRSEGVKNPPKSGFVVGRSAQKGKEEIELVLNMSKFFDELGGMEGINQSQPSGSDIQNKVAEDDEDFESASQVTGPRRPVWEAPKSEVESIASHFRSARMSGIAVETFVSKPESNVGTKKAPKPVTPKRRSSEQRPQTAPSRSRSSVDLNLSDGHDSPAKPSKSPRSRPTTPKGSVVGSRRASRRVSQSSNLSATGRKSTESPTHANDEPDTATRKS